MKVVKTYTKKMKPVKLLLACSECGNCIEYKIPRRMSVAECVDRYVSYMRCKECGY